MKEVWKEQRGLELQQLLDDEHFDSKAYNIYYSIQELLIKVLFHVMAINAKSEDPCTLISLAQIS